MPQLLQLAFGSALKQLWQIITPSSSVLLRFRQRLHSTMGAYSDLCLTHIRCSLDSTLFLKSALGSVKVARKDVRFSP